MSSGGSQTRPGQASAEKSMTRNLQGCTWANLAVEVCAREDRQGYEGGIMEITRVLQNLQSIEHCVYLLEDERRPLKLCTGIFGVLILFLTSIDCQRKYMMSEVNQSMSDSVLQNFCVSVRRLLLRLLTSRSFHCLLFCPFQCQTSGFNPHSYSSFSNIPSPTSTLPTLQTSLSSSTSSALNPNPPLPPSASLLSLACPPSLNATLLK